MHVPVLAIEGTIVRSDECKYRALYISNLHQDVYTVLYTEFFCSGKRTPGQMTIHNVNASDLDLSENQSNFDKQHTREAQEILTANYD